MGRTKSEDAVKKLSLVLPFSLMLSLCLAHFSALELTRSKQKCPGREAHHTTKMPSALSRAADNRQPGTENKLLQQLSASRGALC